MGVPLSALLSKSYSVIGFDVDREKISLLSNGKVPLQEPGLPELVSRQIASGGLRFTAQAERIAACDVKILTVGTPYDIETKRVDYSQLDQALELTARHLSSGDVIIVKSTVPPEPL